MKIAACAMAQKSLGPSHWHSDLKFASYLGIPSHGGLYRWRGNSFPFFVHQKLKEILIRYIRIILKASKDRLISKISRV